MISYRTLDHLPYAARQLLRERLRQVYSPDIPQIQGPDGKAGSDELTLRGLRESIIVPLATEDEARRILDDLRIGISDDALPRLTDLVQRGLIQVAWGRFSVPFSVYGAIARSPMSRVEHALAALKPVDRSRWSIQIASGLAADLVARQPESLPGAATAGLAGTAAVEALRQVCRQCPRPSWVAARLWEEVASRGDDAALSQWVDCLELLEWPLFEPSQWLDKTTRRSLRQLAFKRLATESGLLGWHAWRVAIATAAGAQHGHLDATPEDFAIPAVPAGLLDRWEWMHVSNMRTEGPRESESMERVLELARLILAEIAATEGYEEAADDMRRYMELAREHPALLSELDGAVGSRHRELAADLLLSPGTAALGVAMVVRMWRAPVGHDREASYREARDRWRDAVIVTVSFALRAFLSAPEVEAASDFHWLVRWLLQESTQQIQRNYSGPDYRFALDRLWTDFLGWRSPEGDPRTPERLLPAITRLAETALRPGAGELGWSAVADGAMFVRRIADSRFPVDLRSLRLALIERYAALMATSEDVLSEARVELLDCEAIVGAAVELGGSTLATFLRPVDFARRAQEAAQTGSIPYDVEASLVQRVRVHIRVLARGVRPSAVFRGAAAVLATLEALTRAAARHDPGQGYIGAFGVEWETTQRYGTPPMKTLGAELADTIAVLPDPDRGGLVSAARELTEPAALAAIVARLPESPIEGIRQRIRSLGPSTCSKPFQLAGTHLRVQALLEAGLTVEGEAFLRSEPEDRWSQTPHDAFLHLRYELRLAMLRGWFDDVLRRTSEYEGKVALLPEMRDTLDFHRGAALFLKDDGDPAEAERLFRRLHERRPSVHAYTVNLHAVIARNALPRPSDGPLTEDQRRAAIGALAAGASMMARFAGEPEAEADEIYPTNTILLLLALRDLAGVINFIQELPTARRTSPRFMAYEVIALAQMGRTGEARDLFDYVARVHGATPELARAAEVLGGRPLVEQVQALQVEPVQTALFRLLRLPPDQQAVVVSGDPRGTAASFLVEEIRRACARIERLAPLVTVQKKSVKEERLTALLEILIHPRVERLGWHIQRESPGGHTGSDGRLNDRGGEGSRDLIILDSQGRELAVVEPLIIPASIKYIRLHYQKMFGYSLCRLFFLVAYSQRGSANEALEKLRNIALAREPAGFTYIRTEEMGSSDPHHEPLAFAVIYEKDRREARAVCIVVDLAQVSARDNARLART